MSGPIIDVILRPFLFSGVQYNPGDQITVGDEGRRAQLLEQRKIRRVEMNETVSPERAPDSHLIEGSDGGPLPQSTIDEALAILDPPAVKAADPGAAEEPEPSEPVAKPRKRSRATEEATEEIST